MTSIAREFRGWLALAVIVLVFGAGLAMRSGTVEPVSVADPGASPEADVSSSPTAEPITPANQPLSEAITPPTRPSASSPTDAPGASPTPTPVAAAPSAPPPAPAPPASTPTPVPVHDDDPVLLTEERVDGSFGQSLTVGGYSVSAVRKSVPASDGCVENHTGDVEVFDVTITYSGPIFDVQFAIERPTAFWCVDGSGGASQMFPSGVTRQVVVGYAEGYVGADAPLVVWVLAVNGPHTLTFAFH